MKCDDGELATEKASRAEVFAKCYENIHQARFKDDWSGLHGSAFEPASADEVLEALKN